VRLEREQRSEHRYLLLTASAALKTIWFSSRRRAPSLLSPTDIVQFGALQLRPVSTMLQSIAVCPTPNHRTAWTALRRQKISNAPGLLMYWLPAVARHESDAFSIIRLDFDQDLPLEAEQPIQRTPKELRPSAMVLRQDRNMR
jgi:hypothetical protein